MAVKTMVDQNGDYTFYGLSTDTKPVGNYNLNTIFVEIDTKKKWRYVEGNVNATTTNCWWEI